MAAVATDTRLCCVCCTMHIGANHSDRCVLPCGHLYCLTCVGTRSRVGLQDRSCVPAHCCRKEFPIELVKRALSPLEFVLYERFLSEKHWTAVDLDSDREYARAAKEHGCVQCPGCGVGVSRIAGCNRMKCFHGHEFCFECGKVWKTCPCYYPGVP